MKPTEAEIERLLRQAPQPPPPADLRPRLEPEPGGARGSAPVLNAPWAAWWRAWWPAFATGIVALASLGLVATQHAEIKALRQSVEALRQEIRVHQQNGESATPAPHASAPGHRPPQTPVVRGRAELERLRGQADELRAELARRESIAQENDRLRAELTRLAQAARPVVATEELSEARERAKRIACVNNLKQLGLAVRLFAVDHQDRFPPNILAMSNEVANPRVLICPSDTGRQPAPSWAEFNQALHLSYQYLGATADETEPHRVIFQCPIHGSVTLADGSVQQLTPEQQATRLIWEGGVLRFRVDSQPGALAMDDLMMQRYGLVPPPAPGSGEAMPPVQMDRLMMERYGLLPPGTALTDPLEEPHPPTADPIPENP